MTARLIIGDVRDVLPTLPAGSVDFVLTSSPFFNLRNYLLSNHPDKRREIGTESTPGEFIDTLLDVTEQLDRVIAPHGSLAWELGDTYSGSGGAGGDYNDGGLREGQPKFKTLRRKDAGAEGHPDGKSLCLIPELYRVALAYGFNPLTGRTTARWRVRNNVRWFRTNPPVGELADKYRPATSDMVIACKSRDRWFDLDAVRTELARDYTDEKPTKANREFDRTGAGRKTTERTMVANPAGAPPLDTWIISTQPYKGAHYATWPEELCVIPILSMCPERVCMECGEPSRRIVERESAGVGFRRSRENVNDQAPSTGFYESHRETVGWTDCGHNAWRPGVVLDPFAGSGTTLQVATRLARDAIGIDLDERNADLVHNRVGMFFSGVEYLKDQVA